jgi:hypothetical protein
VGTLSDERRSYLLSELAYAQFFNKPEYANQYEGTTTLGQLVEDFKNTNIKTDGGIGPSDLKEAFKEIQADPVLSNLTFTNYENNNVSGNWDGFVGYSFKDASGNAYFTFRGSESDTPEGQHDGFLGVDWTDNYTMGIEGKSLQFADVKSFVADNSVGSEKIYVTGHSKGGANALYASAAFNNVTCIAFDAPGIDQAISSEERERMIESGAINFVASDDKVGALLFHSEDRIFCKMNSMYFVTLNGKVVEVNNYNQAEGMSELEDSFVPHSMQAFLWDNNSLVKTDRSSGSMFTEALTQSLYDWNVNNGRPLDGELNWIINNKKDLGDAFKKKILESFLGESLKGITLGGDEILGDFVLNAFYADRDIEEITSELVDKYIKLDNIAQKISYDVKKDKKSIETDIEEDIKDIEKVENNIEEEAQDFYEDAENLVSDVETAGNAVINAGSEFLDDSAQALDNVVGSVENMFGFGGQPVNLGTYMHVDINKLRDYTYQLEVLRRKANDIEMRINGLYFRAGLKNIVPLLKSSYMDGNNNNFRAIIDYLNFAADTFENNEQKLLAMLNSIG